MSTGFITPAVAGKTDTIVVGSVFGGSVHAPFHRSSLMMLAHELRRPDGERKLARQVSCQGVYVASNRQSISTRFYRDPAEVPWLLFIDSDIEFPQDFLDTVLSLAAVQRAKILAVNVPLGKHPTSAYVTTEEPGIFANLYPLPNEQVFPVDAAATAVMLIHADVFQAIAEAHGQCWFNHSYIPWIPKGRPETMAETRFREIGEDLAFCIRAKSVGFQTWVAQKVEGVRHHKTRPLSDTGIEEQAGVAEALFEGEQGELVREV